MKKLYVIISSRGRTPEQVANIREQIRQDVEEGLMEDIRLSLPPEGSVDVSGDVYAILRSDITVSTEGSMFDRDCRICNHVASEYMEFGVYEEDWVASIVKGRHEDQAREDDGRMDNELGDGGTEDEES